MSRVKCTTCHRVEDWAQSPSGWSRTERAAGGARRSASPGHDALEVVLAEPRRVVAACPACGQPMVGDGPPPIPWTFRTGEGPVTVEPGAPPSREAVARIRAANPPAPVETQSRWALGFQLVVLLLMLGPIAVWLFSVVYVTFFLSHASDAL